MRHVLYHEYLVGFQDEHVELFNSGLKGIYVATLKRYVCAAGPQNMLRSTFDSRRKRSTLRCDERKKSEGAAALSVQYQT